MRNYQKNQIAEKENHKKHLKDKEINNEVNNLRDSIASISKEQDKIKQDKYLKMHMYKEVLDKQLEEKEKNKPQIMSDIERKLNKDLLKRILTKINKKSSAAVEV